MDLGSDLQKIGEHKQGQDKHLDQRNGGFRGSVGKVSSARTLVPGSSRRPTLPTLLGHQVIYPIVKTLSIIDLFSLTNTSTPKSGEVLRTTRQRPGGAAIIAMEGAKSPRAFGTPAASSSHTEPIGHQDQQVEPSPRPLKRPLPDNIGQQHPSGPMKRLRSQVSPTMSPSADNGGFVVNGEDHAVNGVNVENVIIVGAGPAGLMLG